MKKYALKGINDDQTECAICGKTELRRVMWIVELDADGSEIGEPFHCGTTCGSKLLNRTAPQLRTILTNYESKISLRRHELAHAKETELGREEILQQLTGMTWKERTAHPLWAKLHEISEAAHTWANQQQIIIPL